MVSTQNVIDSAKQKGIELIVRQSGEIKKKTKGFFVPEFLPRSSKERIESVLHERAPDAVRKKTKPRWFRKTPFGVPRGINPFELRKLAASWIVQACVGLYQADARSMKYKIIPVDPAMADSQEVIDTIVEVNQRLERINEDGECIQDLWEKWIKDILEIDAGVFVAHFPPEMYEEIADTYGVVQRFVPETAPRGRALEITVEDGALFYKDFFDDGKLMGYWQHSYNEQVPLFFGKREISYTIFNPSTYSPYGWSKVQQLYNVLITMVAAVLNISEYNSGGAIPPGLIELRGADSDETDAFRAYWRTKVEGSPHKFAVVGTPETGELKFIPLNFDINDILFLDGLEFFWRVVMATFHVSPNELGITDTVNRATSESQERVNRRLQKVPMFTKIERLMNTFILPEITENYHLVKFVWDVEEDVAKEKLKDDIITQQVNQGRLTLNEARIMMGQEPYDIPEANLPLNLLQLMKNPVEDDPAIDIAQELQDIVQEIQSRQKEITEEDIKLSNRIDRNVRKEEKKIKNAIVNALRSWFNAIKEKIKRLLTRNPEQSVNQALLTAVTEITQPGNATLEEIKNTLKKNLVAIFEKAWELNEDLTPGEGVFAVPPRDALEFLNTHSLLIAEKLTTDLSLRTKQTLIEGIGKGESIPKLAKRIQEVMGTSKTRATTIARTETIRAFAEGNYQRIKAKGFERWKYFAHLDDRTCEICIDLHMKTYDIENKTKLPPRHPNCRCTVLPVFND